MEDQVKKLQDELDAEKLRVAALMVGIDERDAHIEKLEAKSDSPSVKEVEKPAIPEAAYETADGESYRLVVPSFIHNGKLILAKNAIEDAELMCELIEMQSGIMKKD